VDIKISARHGHLAEKTQASISERVEKLRKFHDRVSEIAVTVDLGHAEKPDVEVIVHVEQCPEFVAREQNGELFAALDGCMHKLEQQLKKHKQKMIDSHRVPGTKEHPAAGADD
jgi:putative sigma-54 modulation protein